MGITLEEFENMNPRMIESYRKGFEQRQELEDEKMWNWFGTYGISAVMVAVEHALLGKDAKSEYLKESITKMQRRENGELTEEEKHMCIQVFDRICNNAEEHLREYKKKTNENESLDMKSTGNHLFYSQLMEKEQDQKDGREQLQTTDSGCDGSNI